MKIIFQGKEPGERLCRGTCDKCGTIVEFKRKEAHRMELAHHQLDEPTYHVYCPTCKAEITGSQVRA